MPEKCGNINFSKVFKPIKTTLGEFNTTFEEFKGYFENVSKSIERIAGSFGTIQKSLQGIDEYIRSLPPDTRKNIHNWSKFYLKHRDKHPKLYDMNIIELVEWVERIIQKGLLDDYFVSFNAKKYIEQRNKVVEFTDRHVLEAVISTWLKEDVREDDENLFIKMKFNDILAFTGTAPRISSSGIKSGYLQNQKEAVEKSLGNLIKMGLLLVESYPRYLWVRPSDLMLTFINEDYKTKLLAKRIYQLKSPEQREGAYYVYYIWRNRQKDESYTEPFKIKKLLEKSYLKDPKKQVRAQRVADQFYDMLENWKDLDIIKYYEIIKVGENAHKIENEDEVITRKPNGWFKDWLNWKISIEPPDDLFDYYREHIDKKQKKKKRKKRTAGDHIKKMKTQRENKKLTQDELGKILGISGRYVSMLERGKRVPTKKIEEKIKKFVTL